jgi:hypothetical protein
MYLRTADRAWFDLAEAWARYHADLQSWRTDGWHWKDGAIWFPTGGPLGNKPVREKWNFKWGPAWGERKSSSDCQDLFRTVQAKSCYCHFYGSGLADYYCLTGDIDALRAAIDSVETKDSEFRQYRDFESGKAAVGSIRGFGRGFEVIMRVLQADPKNKFTADLAHLCARTLWNSPLLDERGFHCSRIGRMPAKDLSPKTRQWMSREEILIEQRSGQVTGFKKGRKTWTVRAMGGTWMHVYVQNGAELYATFFDDDDMRDFAIAFAQMSARYMLSKKCRQTWYYAFWDVTEPGSIYDPWTFEHADTDSGEGCVHSGYYTRHYVDACTKGYSLTGEKHLLEKAKEFWYYGSKRRYRTKGLHGGKNGVGMFAFHRPPKDDTILSTARLFYETAHAREDSMPPRAISDLRARIMPGNRAEISFSAPSDVGGGKVVKYQVKASDMPIVPYEQWDPAADPVRKRNWWRAVNCRREPAPLETGKSEKFIVFLPPGTDFERTYFAVRSFDDSNNRSAISNVVEAEK